MLKNRGPNKFRRRVTGASASLTGGGVSAALVKTDGAYLQELIDFLDDKGAFFDPIHAEVPRYVTEAVPGSKKISSRY